VKERNPPMKMREAGMEETEICSFNKLNPYKKPSGTPINTDEYRFFIKKRPKDKRLNGTRMNADKHGGSFKDK